jgi:hypothetical protein
MCTTVLVYRSATHAAISRCLTGLALVKKYAGLSPDFLRREPRRCGSSAKAHSRTLRMHKATFSFNSGAEGRRVGETRKHGNDAPDLPGR